jgi:hypothetical protein
MEAVATWIRRAVALLIGLVAYATFIPVGLFFYIFLLSRAVLTLALASFVAAMTTRPFTTNAEAILHHSVSFFPKGLETIYLIVLRIWRGDTATAVDAAEVNLLASPTTILLAVLFSCALITVLSLIGVPILGLTSVASILKDPLLLVVLVAFISFIAIVGWQMFRDSWDHFTGRKPHALLESTPPSFENSSGSSHKTSGT